MNRIKILTTPTWNHSTSCTSRFQSALPSLPNSGFGEKYSRQAVKTAVEDKEEYSRELSEEKEEKSFEVKEAPRPHFEPKFQTKLMEPRVSERAPIFVRIDKFEDAIQSFEEVKRKISEFAPDLVGVTMMTYHHKLAYDLVAYLKSYQVPE